MPHALVADLPAPVIVVGLSPAGIDFRSRDESLSHIIILLLCPSTQPQLEQQLLTRITATFSRPVFFDEVMQAKTRVELLALMAIEAHAISAELHDAPRVPAFVPPANRGGGGAGADGQGGSGTDADNHSDEHDHDHEHVNGEEPHDDYHGLHAQPAKMMMVGDVEKGVGGVGVGGDDNAAIRSPHSLGSITLPGMPQVERRASADHFPSTGMTMVSPASEAALPVQMGARRSTNEGFPAGSGSGVATGASMTRRATAPPYGGAPVGGGAGNGGSDSSLSTPNSGSTTISHHNVGASSASGAGAGAPGNHNTDLANV